ncbi:MAG: hypothetical protein JW863_22040 [Chitinispirillaceae bacterium]|nr:hypothetical protein [Chitinispirillaceae bacterium]
MAQRGTLAVLVDNEEDLRIAGEVTDRVLFELPVDCGKRIDQYSTLFTRYPDLIPWFPSILIGEHYTSALTLLDRICPAMIITDNSGIAAAAADREIPWIAGPLLNCTNSFALRAFHTYAAGAGAFVSHELSREQMHAVTAPEGCSLWYTVYAPLLLMNTRQCIIRNCTGCGTERVTETCIGTCEKSIDLTDTKRQPFHVVKRRGFYNQVYNGRYYFNPAVIDEARAANAVFLIDLRTMPSQSKLLCSKQEFITIASEAIARRGQGGGAATMLKPLAMTTTAGQYARGI